jgi:hypothetical protein
MLTWNSGSTALAPVGIFLSKGLEAVGIVVFQELPEGKQRRRVSQMRGRTGGREATVREHTFFLRRLKEATTKMTDDLLTLNGGGGGRAIRWLLPAARLMPAFLFTAGQGHLLLLEDRDLEIK